MGSQTQQAMAMVVLIILSLLIRDVVGSNSFDHVPEECRAKHYVNIEYDEDHHEGNLELDHSQLMTNIVEDFLELDLLSSNLTMYEFCSMRIPYFHTVTMMKSEFCSQHSTRVCEDYNGVPIEGPYDYQTYYDNYCPTHYSPEQNSIYWFIVKSVEEMEKEFEKWKKLNTCEDSKTRRFRMPPGHLEQDFFRSLERFLIYIRDYGLNGNYRIINIETWLWKMLKHKYRNSDREKKEVDKAIESIFRSPSMDLDKLFEVFLQNPSKESKLLFKMVLTEYLSKNLKKKWNEHYKCYLYHCESNLMYCSKKEFAILDILIGTEKDRYKTAIQTIVETIDDVLENYGPFPYIELVHELVEQFDDIKHDLVNIHHQNILKMKNFMERRVWYEIYSILSSRFYEIKDKVMKDIACVEKENPVSLFMKNIQSEISREVLDMAVQQLKVVAKELLTSFRGKVHYVVRESMEHIMNVLNCDDWTELFMVGSNESLQLTNYLKNNKDGLGNVVNLRLKASYLEDLQKYVVLLIKDANSKDPSRNLQTSMARNIFDTERNGKC